jgi:hypothetical protein
MSDHNAELRITGPCRPASRVACFRTRPTARSRGPFRGRNRPAPTWDYPTPLKVVLGFRLLKSSTPGTGAQVPNNTLNLHRVNWHDFMLFYISRVRCQFTGGRIGSALLTIHFLAVGRLPVAGIPLSADFLETSDSIRYCKHGDKYGSSKMGTRCSRAGD